jgi:hypothetical protein
MSSPKNLEGTINLPQCSRTRLRRIMLHFMGITYAYDDDISPQLLKRQRAIINSPDGISGSGRESENPIKRNIL